MMSRLKAILIDLSGTIHIDNDVIPGAVQALSRLREAPVKLKFVTNTSKESKNELYTRLISLGFKLDKSELFTSLTVARQVIEAQQLRPHFILEDSALEDFQGINCDNPNAVLVGLAPSKFNYENLTYAFRLLLDGCRLIAIHKAPYYKRPDGLALGPGPFVAALEYAAETKAVIVAKPQKQFYHGALKEFECEPGEAVMIGDDVRDDVIGAQEAGLTGLLVKTGKYRNGDEDKYESKPNIVKENFPDAVDYIIKHLL